MSEDWESSETRRTLALALPRYCVISLRTTPGPLDMVDLMVCASGERRREANQPLSQRKAQFHLCCDWRREALQSCSLVFWSLTLETPTFFLNLNQAHAAVHNCVHRCTRIKHKMKKTFFVMEPIEKYLIIHATRRCLSAYIIIIKADCRLIMSAIMSLKAAPPCRLGDPGPRTSSCWVAWQDGDEAVTKSAAPMGKQQWWWLQWWWWCECDSDMSRLSSLKGLWIVRRPHSCQIT